MEIPSGPHGPNMPGCPGRACIAGDLLTSIAQIHVARKKSGDFFQSIASVCIRYLNIISKYGLSIFIRYFTWF